MQRAVGLVSTTATGLVGRLLRSDVIPVNASLRTAQKEQSGNEPACCRYTWRGSMSSLQDRRQLRIRIAFGHLIRRPRRRGRGSMAGSSGQAPSRFDHVLLPDARRSPADRSRHRGPFDPTASHRPPGGEEHRHVPNTLAWTAFSIGDRSSRYPRT